VVCGAWCALKRLIVWPVAAELRLIIRVTPGSHKATSITSNRNINSTPIHQEHDVGFYCRVLGVGLRYRIRLEFLLSPVPGISQENSTSIVPTLMPKMAPQGRKADGKSPKDSQRRSVCPVSAALCFKRSRLGTTGPRCTYQ